MFEKVMGFAKKKQDEKLEKMKKEGKTPTLWDKMPITVKLGILGGAVSLFLMVIFVAVLASLNPLNWLNFSDSVGGYSASSGKSEEEYYREEYANYWIEMCNDESRSCTKEQKAREEQMIKDQIELFKELDEVVSSQEIPNNAQRKRVKNIILTTLFFDYSTDEFIKGEDNAFNIDGNSEIDENEDVYNMDEEGDVYVDATDDIKELMKQFKVYLPLCTYKGVEDGKIVDVTNEITKEDGSKYNLSFLERLSLNVFGGAFVDEEIKNAKKSCLESYTESTFKIEETIFGESSEENYYNYLINTDYLDNRPNLKNYYSDYAKSLEITNDVSKWPLEYKKKVREQIVKNIKEIIEEYYSIEKEKSNALALIAQSFCPNGITVEGEGTLDFEEYLIGVLNQEFGGLITHNEEAAKVAAVASRTFVIASTNNCQISIKNSQTQITYSKPTSYYDIYKKALDDTRGEVLVNAEGKVTGGQFVTLPVSLYRETVGSNYVFHMQGISGNEKTEYDYTIAIDDVKRIANTVGGILYPSESSGHHWGISAYALAKMAEDGMDYREIIANTYETGGVVHLARGLMGDEKGLQLNSNETFLMRVEGVEPDKDNPYYSKSYGKYGQCAWYAMERADEIMSTMGWYKTNAFIKNRGNGGDGNGFCGDTIMNEVGVNKIGTHSNNVYNEYDRYTIKDIDNPKAIKPGNLISWEGDTIYGHVAVIEDVVGDDVIISEAWATNPGVGHQSIRTIKKSKLATDNGKRKFICTIDLSSGKD